MRHQVEIKLITEVLNELLSPMSVVIYSHPTRAEYIMRITSSAATQIRMEKAVDNAWENNY